MKLQQIDRNEITSSPLTEEQEIYKENIIDHYKHPKNKSELQNYTHKHREINPLCGDDITLYLKAKNLKKEDILHMLGIPISFVRMKCALLSLKVLQKEVEETQLKN